MKNIIYYFILFLLTVWVTSCEKAEIPTTIDTSAQGYFILNEGIFTQGNASLSYYNVENSTVSNHVFENANNRPLGDVAQSMTLFNNLLYIVVNNSGKIEVLDPHTSESIKTIIGFTSPRYLLPINNEKAYVSDLYDPHIYIVNLAKNEISGKIITGRSTEHLLFYDDKAFVLNWSFDSTLQIIDTQADTLLTTLNVGWQPNSIVQDKNNKLWVLSDGQIWSNPNNKSQLIRLDMSTFEIEKKYELHATKDEGARCLKIDAKGETLYFINKHIFKMAITDDTIPTASFIHSNEGQIFYNFYLNENEKQIWVCDALDYTQRGLFHIFDREGKEIKNHIVGLIPNDIIRKEP